MSTDKILAGIAGILAIVALLGVGASGTLLAIGVILLAATYFV